MENIDTKCDIADGSHENWHILLVDDSSVNRDLVQLILKKMGHSVDTAENGREAVDLVNQNHYHAILMDVQMPVMDGYAATACIRKMGGEAGTVPIIAMTAHAMAGDRQKCIQAGMNDYVAKPIHIDLLKEALWRVQSKPDAIDPESKAGEGVPVEAGATVLDWDRLVQRMSGEEGLAKKILKGFIEEAPKRMEQLAGAIKKGDADQFADALHALKGSAAIVGAVRLQRVAISMERESCLTKENERIKRLERNLASALENLKRAAAKHILTQAD